MNNLKILTFYTHKSPSPPPSSGTHQLLPVLIHLTTLDICLAYVATCSVLFLWLSYFSQHKVLKVHPHWHIWQGPHLQCYAVLQCMYVPHLFIPSSMKAYLGCFHLESVLNLLLWSGSNHLFAITSDIHPGFQLLYNMTLLLWISEKHLYCFLVGAQGFLFSIFLQTFVILFSFPFNTDFLMDVKLPLIMFY